MGPNSHPQPDESSANLYATWHSQAHLPYSFDNLTLEECVTVSDRQTTYLGHLQSSGVAVSVCVFTDSSLDQLVKRLEFLEYLRQLSNARHSQIHPIASFGIVDSCPYVVTHRVAGIDLEHVLTRGEIPVRDSIRFALETTTAFIELSKLDATTFSDVSFRLLLTPLPGCRDTDLETPVAHENLTVLLTELEQSYFKPTSTKSASPLGPSSGIIRYSTALHSGEAITTIGDFLKSMATSHTASTTDSADDRRDSSTGKGDATRDRLGIILPVMRRCVSTDTQDRYRDLRELADDLDGRLDALSHERASADSNSSIGRCIDSLAVMSRCSMIYGLLAGLLIFLGYLYFGFSPLRRQVDKASTSVYATKVLKARELQYKSAKAESLRLLDDTTSSRRNWEWGYLRRQLNVSPKWTLNFNSPIEFFGSCDEGKYIAVLLKSGVLEVLELDSPSSIVRTPGTTRIEHTDLPRIEWYSTLAERLDSQRSSISDAVSRAAAFRANHTVDSTTLPSSVSIGSYRHLRVGSARSGWMIRDIAGHDAIITSAAISSDETVLASGDSDGYVVIHDDKLAERPIRWRAHEGSVRLVVLHHEKREVLTGTEDGRCTLWSLKDLADEPCVLVAPNSMRSISFCTSDDELAVVDEAGTTNVIEGEFGKNRWTVGDFSSTTTSFSMGPTGAWFLTGDDQGKLRVWDRRRGVLVATRQAEAAVCSLSIHRAGIPVSVGMQDGRVAIWDVVGGRQIGAAFEAHRGAVLCTAYSPDGRRLATAGQDGRVKWWGVEARGEPRTVWDGGAAVTALVWSPDSDWLAGGDERGRIALWDAATGKVHAAWDAHEGPVTCLAVSPDGRRLASAGRDRWVKLWDPADGVHFPVLPQQPHVVTSLAFGNDGLTLAAGAQSGHVKLWHAWPW